MTQPEKQKLFHQVINKLKKTAAFAEAMRNEQVTKETASTIRQLADDAKEESIKLHRAMWATGD